jgi:hypothetical protein
MTTASPAEARPTSSARSATSSFSAGRVFFTATFALVQRLLAAKRDLRLDKELAALDAYDAVILDDIGYVQQSRDEMEVLFTFLAERYERRSVIITSNVVFSEWDRISKDPMTTAAAIDRLVHHADAQGVRNTQTASTFGLVVPTTALRKLDSVAIRIESSHRPFPRLVMGRLVKDDPLCL